jgi:hypothetical protein
MRSQLVLLSRVLIVAAAVTVAAIRFAVIDSGSHSASDTLRPWAIEVVLIAVVAAVAVFAVGRLARATR